MIEVQLFLDGVRALREALGLFKDGRDVLHPGPARDRATELIDRAERALAEADAKLARELASNPLCGCTFPPQVMLWVEVEKRFVCPNPDCGHKTQTKEERSRRIGEMAAKLNR